MVIILGKTCSGKDTIVNKLIDSHGFKKIVTSTTRPMRKGEKQDITYHFLSEEDFKQKINEGYFVEYKTYDTEFGKWYYGTSLEDLKNAEDNNIIILTPDGYRDVVNKLSKKPIAIYIYANNATIKNRLLKRGDDKNEAERRVSHDNDDFKGIENEVDKIVYNNENDTIDGVVDKIVKYMSEVKD